MHPHLGPFPRHAPTPRSFIPHAPTPRFLPPSRTYSRCQSDVRRNDGKSAARPRAAAARAELPAQPSHTLRPISREDAQVDLAFVEEPCDLSNIGVEGEPGAENIHVDGD